MKRVKVAIPPGWDEATVDIIFRNLLRRNLGGEYEVRYDHTPDYGGFALVECPDSDWSAIETEARKMSYAMEMPDNLDALQELRRMSEDDRNDAKKITAVIERFFSEIDNSDHIR